MTDWFYERTDWIVDREHPAKTVARLVAIVFAFLPLVALIAVTIIK